MRTIYYDSDFKCHTTNDSNMTAVQTEVFDGKCDAYIEGCQYVSIREAWMREHCKWFTGEMIAL